MTTEDEEYVPTEEDIEAEAFFAEMIRRIRNGIVRSLLAGNDTQCFTTRQYRDAYRTQFGPREEGLKQFQLSDEGAHIHLSHCELVRQVEPGVWAAS